MLMRLGILLAVVGSLFRLGKADEIDFDHQIAPIFVSNCNACHSGPDPSGGLDLTGRSGAAKTLVAGHPDESLLWQRVVDGEMPPKKPLTEAEQQLLLKWIESGAKWGTDPIDPYRFTTASRAGRDWWALQPIRPVAPPVSMKHPVDAFIEKELGENQLSMSPAADSATLIRRVYLGLTGLPPTPEQVDAFVASEDSSAFENLVDDLLASPQYGERWARHWLDVVRFGETDGFERNAERPNAYHYRNWVIDALNADMPYDEFARLQLAGDLLMPDHAGAVSATGYLTAGVHNTVLGNDSMRAIARQDELEDLVGSVTQTFLGMTANCARCHDHKFDPITQTDYFRLASALSGAGFGERKIPGNDREKWLRLLKVLKPVFERRVGDDEGMLGSHLRRRFNVLLRDLVALADDAKKERVYANVPRDPAVTRVLIRGDVESPGEVVSPGGIASVLGSIADFGLSPDASDEDRRIKLAQWVTSPENPLFARVLVNRVWHYHFGTGLVESPSDFGFSGGRPSHPELLNWLANEFTTRNYSLKELHKIIVTSETYRQSSQPRNEALVKDADNRLLWRFSPRRLEAETIRDRMLFTSGLLNPEFGGKGFSDYIEQTFNGTSYFEPYDPVGPEFHRRSIYRFTPRAANQGLLDALDCPDPAVSAPRRTPTTTPIQALAMWNNNLVLRLAGEFSKRLEREASGIEQQIERAWQLALQREPTVEEFRVAEELVRDHGLSALARVLFNSNEFVIVE